MEWGTKCKHNHCQTQSEGIKDREGCVLINQFCILRNIMHEELQPAESQAVALLARSQRKP